MSRYINISTGKPDKLVSEIVTVEYTVVVSERE